MKDMIHEARCELETLYKRLDWAMDEDSHDAILREIHDLQAWIDQAEEEENDIKNGGFFHVA